MNSGAILCIEDDALLLDFLVFQLERITSGHMQVLRAKNGADGIQLGRDHQPGLVILDLGLPDIAGEFVAAEMAAINPLIRILVLTAAVPEMAFGRLMNGRNIQGVLVKSSSQGADLEQAVNEVLAGRRYFQGAVLAAMARARREPDHFSKILSRRETELLPLFGYGWPNGKIARYTQLSPATVRTHHQNILAKLNLHGREELMRWALKKGFIDFRHEPGAVQPGQNARHAPSGCQSVLRNIT
ncbi:MAG: response regulator transcription factor [Lacunisphaera sp.]|nr:response regulator transcription factor [Lacunisphaera sp.]